MSTFGRTAPAPPVTSGTDTMCVACRRSRTRQETRTLDNGEPARLCVDPADCRRHWPADDRAVVALAGGPR